MRKSCPLFEKIFLLKNFPCLCSNSNNVQCGFYYSPSYDCYYCNNLIERGIFLEELKKKAFIYKINNSNSNKGLR